jgi:hypothetical protein
MNDDPELKELDLLRTTELVYLRNELNRLLDIAEQALRDVDFDNRKVLGTAGLAALKNAVDYHRTGY